MKTFFAIIAKNRSVTVFEFLWFYDENDNFLRPLSFPLYFVLIQEKLLASLGENWLSGFSTIKSYYDSKEKRRDLNQCASCG